MIPTEQQNDILDVALNTARDLQIVAYAGTGKTSTLHLLDQALAAEPRLYLAFNKGVVKEIEKKEILRPTTIAKTLNSLGHGVWSKAIGPRLQVNPQKTLEIFREYAKSQNNTDELWEFYQEIKTAVDLAKNVGYIPDGHAKAGNSLVDSDTFFYHLEDELPYFGQQAVDEILLCSIKFAYSGNIDFNDQLYMPALFGGSWPKFPIIMADEFQDFSPVNHLMLAKLVKGARLIAVGDPYQSIYAFRGAMTNGMAIAKERFEMATAPLSVSFRCPQAIVANARWRAPGFKALNPGGHVEHLRSLGVSEVADGSAIICRNNAPLFKLALKLISGGRSVSMAGTDIGPKLLGILKRLGDASLPRPSVLGAIEDWLVRRGDSVSAADTADCLRVFANLGANLGESIAAADFIFRQEGSILLSTGHKAKGLEWPTVYHLDPWLLGTNEQDLNLRYVIQTRSSDAYFEINSDQIET